MRLVLCVLVALATGGFSEPAKKVLPQKTVDPVFLQRQLDVIEILYHIHEPIFIEKMRTAATSWNLENNLEHYTNVTAVKQYVILKQYGLLPRGVPFSVLNPHHSYEASTLFNVLYSAKDYDTFYKTAAYLRDIVNEELFVHIFSTAILNRPDTQGIKIPPIYEIFPSFFFNGEVMTMAQRINTHGMHMVEQFPKTFVRDDDVVIRWNETVWPYFSEEHAIFYLTHDPALNAFYYNRHLTYPAWLGGEVVPLWKDRRGEIYWFTHRQILTRYYMERLCNGLGEIPELGLNIVEKGHNPGLVHYNGVPYPVRPNYFHLEQPHLVDKLIYITDVEERLRTAIDSGYYISSTGEHVRIDNPESIDVLGRLVEASVDSPNNKFYKDFVSVWKLVLGNSVAPNHHHYHQKHALALPSVLEQYQTSMRDPAFYMIWKRVLKLVNWWFQSLPVYKHEELALPSVEIQKVETDKLVTYFEYAYYNVTNHLHMNEHERQVGMDDVSVLVQRPQLNHKIFQIRVNVTSDVAKKVLVKFFLAPKYDSNGYEIPLHVNSENFYLLDFFTHDLPQGESIIKRDSTENQYAIDDWTSGSDVYSHVEEALHDKKPFVIDQSERFDGYPQRLMLPKGRVGGMPFILLVHISEFQPAKVKQGTGFDPAISLGLGSGARYYSDKNLAFPVDRPLFYWQIQDVHNIALQDVFIHYKPTPEIDVPHHTDM